MEPHIAIVDASIGDTPAERNLTREIDAETRTYKASEGERPPAPGQRDRAYDAVVISGSQTSVYDDHDWIHELTAWVRTAQRADVRCSGSVGATSCLPRRSVAGSSIWAPTRSATDRSEQRGDDPLLPGSTRR